MSVVVGIVVGIALCGAWLGLMLANARAVAQRRFAAGVALAVVRWTLVIATFVALAKGGPAMFLPALVGFTAVRLAATRRIAARA